MAISPSTAEPMLFNPYIDNTSLRFLRQMVLEHIARGLAGGVTAGGAR